MELTNIYSNIVSKDMITRQLKSSNAFDEEIDMQTGTSNYAVSK